MAILPKCSAVPSLLGCTYIIQHVVRSPKRRNRVYHRLLLCMSFYDALWSIWNFVGTWTNPTDSNTWGAMGTTESCEFMGFVGHLSALSSILYSVALTVFFLLVIVYGWSEAKIQKYCEPWFHMLPNALGWATPAIP